MLTKEVITDAIISAEVKEVVAALTTISTAIIDRVKAVAGVAASTTTKTMLLRGGSRTRWRRSWWRLRRRIWLERGRRKITLSKLDFGLIRFLLITTRRRNLNYALWSSVTANTKASPASKNKQSHLKLTQPNNWSWCRQFSEKRRVNMHTQVFIRNCALRSSATSFLWKGWSRIREMWRSVVLGNLCFSIVGSRLKPCCRRL